MHEPAPAPSALPSAPTLAGLFLSFALASLSGFGGVLPWVRRMIVEERRWLSATQFNEVFSVSQFLPGPNIVNFSIILGSRLFGPIGSLAAVSGLLAPPLAIVTALGALYGHYGEIVWIQRALAGLAAGAAGLLIATAMKMAEPVFARAVSPGPYIALVAFGTVGLLRWPLHWVLLVLAPLSLAIVWWTRK